MNSSRYKMGIDIGSTTAKVVILDQQKEIIYSAYHRHNAQTLDTLLTILQEAIQQLDNTTVKVSITGSAGMGVSEKFELPFVQEVIASAEVVHQLYPQVNTLIDIGGEDAKIIFFHQNGMPDIRMNGACAGGTGAFIDQMATLLNIPVANLNHLAANHTTVHPIASRCGVFAKTDVQNLLSREIAREDIAASIFQAVIYQTLATLARGQTPEPMVLLCGGPLTFLPELRTFFVKSLHIEPSDVLDVPHAELLPAIGAALADEANKRELSLNQLIDLLGEQAGQSQTLTNRLPALFADADDLARWQGARQQQRTPRVSIAEIVGEPCFLGVDSGSTTTKLVLIDRQGRIVFERYRNNNGSAIEAVHEGLRHMRQAFAEHGATPNIARSVVTGYGEDLIKAAFGFDDGMVETLAHFRAARAFDPEVSFILDIGGQDMKAIFVQDGHIQNIEINEACSSGCGSFIETFARSMNYTVQEFAQEACSSAGPCDLGTRCTVFMNSKVKQSLRERASVGDISAGLAYSVIKNAIHKVLKVTNPDVLGEHIVVQGGTFRNPAIHKAMEQMVGREVTCPDISELMGAYGAALTARDTVTVNGNRDSQTDFPLQSAVALEELSSASDYKKQTINCRGCQNLCSITKLIFPNGNTFYTGNRCERIFTNRGKDVTKGDNMFDRKYNLLFDRPARVSPDEGALTIGIPRVLNMYENYPFWHTLFAEVGVNVQLSDTSTSTLYQTGVDTIMSENICFPAKLVHGHIYNLMEKSVDRIFYPMVIFEENEFADACNSFNCPIVSGYPDVVRSAIDPAGKHGVPFDQPPISFSTEKLLKKSCRRYFKTLGIKGKRFNQAFARAVQAQREFKEEIQITGADIMRHANEEERPVVLMMGRPYHIDPLINHKIAEILADFGVDVITEDAIPLEPGAMLENHHVLTQWEYPNRYYYAARWVGQQPNVELVHLNSFGCGPDAIAVDEVKSIMTEYGKGHTVIRIDEIDSTGSVKLRLRSMIESLKQKQATEKPAFAPRKTNQIYQESDQRKTILAPQFSHFYSAPIVRPLRDLGYKVETLPRPDRSSVEAGLKYANNEICYPATVLIGDIIKALQSGKYDPETVTVGITQTGGQCRASSYLSLLKRALVSAHFENVPILSLTTGLTPLNDQPGFKFDLKRYVYKAVLGIIYADAISTMYHSTVVREINKGDSLKLANHFIALLDDGTMPLDKKSVLDTMQEAATAFNTVETNGRDYPRVGLVGEIYVKYNSFGNNEVVQWLIDQGLEVVVPPFMEFFAVWPTNAQNSVRWGLKNPDLMWLLSFVVEKYVQGFLNNAEEVLQSFKFYRPTHTIQDIAAKAQEIVNLTHQYGEGWLIPGEVGTLVRDGVPNVLCLQPFGCIANHVVAKGIEKRLKIKYPNLNLLFLDADAGVSEVNYFNRLYFFANQAKIAV